MNGVRLMVLGLVVATAGCASNPYRNRMVEDVDGKSVQRFFAYGHFCGGDHPAAVGKTNAQGVKVTLADFYPPVDDLDAICYAHDHCYEAEGGNRVSCDDVFHTMMIDAQRNMHGDGCWNLTTDMTIAFFGKNWERGNSGSETFANQVVQTTLGLPTALFWAALKYPVSPFLSYPKEGSCNVGSASDPAAMFTRFEGLYEKALFNPAHMKIAVPIPPAPPMGKLEAKAGSAMSETAGK
jgi:hypothetical protein